MPLEDNTLNQLGAFVQRVQAKHSTTHYRNAWQRLHIDLSLLIGLAFIICAGLLILYSASNQNQHILDKQLVRLGFAVITMLVFAQIPPEKYQLWAPWLYGAGVFLLLAVLIFGVIDKGAQRWLSLGVFRFQPSDIMKLSVPLTLSWYFHDKRLPPNKKDLAIASLLILIPAILVAKQPDLGTAIMIAASGGCVLLLAGIRWQLILALAAILLLMSPIVWHTMHGYQRERVLTFLNPERDPLGAGYHIIQSKIAIGSGGFLGKGWLNGTQSHLNFLPEHATDFIFAVCGEEFGLLGSIMLLLGYLLIVFRTLYISAKGQTTFTRLLAGGLGLTFFLSFFVNIGMVVGLLPVVGLPLPLISYGGTSMVTLFASFGIIMSIETHKRLLRT